MTVREFGLNANPTRGINSVFSGLYTVRDWPLTPAKVRPPCGRNCETETSGVGFLRVVRLCLRGERQRSRGIETANRTVVALGERGLEFIAQPEIDIEPARDFPIVLDEAGEVLVDLGEVGGGRHSDASADDSIQKRGQRLSDGGRGGVAQRARRCRKWGR